MTSTWRARGQTLTRRRLCPEDESCWKRHSKDSLQLHSTRVNLRQLQERDSDQFCHTQRQRELICAADRVINTTKQKGTPQVYTATSVQ